MPALIISMSMPTSIIVACYDLPATQQHGRRLHFHRGADDAGAAGSLTVDARLLRPLCQQTISEAFARRFGAVSQMGYR